LSSQIDSLTARGEASYRTCKAAIATVAITTITAITITTVVTHFKREEEKWFESRSEKK